MNMSAVCQTGHVTQIKSLVENWQTGLISHTKMIIHVTKQKIREARTVDDSIQVSVTEQYFKETSLNTLFTFS